MESFFRDIVHGARTLAKSAGFTGIAVLTLALGIGANTAIFSMLDYLLLRPLEYDHPDQLVMIWEQNTGKGWIRSPTSFANFVDFRDGAKLVDISSFTDTSFNLTGSEQPERVKGLRVSAALFPILRVSPVQGRWFAPQEEQPGAPHVLVLSYGLWQRSFGGDPNILQRPVQIDGVSYSVVGVMPQSFKFPPEFSATVVGTQATMVNADLWVPLRQDDVPLVRDLRNLNMVARLKPGVTVEQAKAELDAIANRLNTEYPEVNTGISAYVIPLDKEVTGDIRTPLLVLMGAVGTVLLIACLNIASLLLARATGRQKEIAIRAALGASRARLIRQLLTESFLLALMAGFVGLLFAIVTTKLIMPFVSADISRLKDLSINGQVLLFTLGISILTALLFGLAPAIDASPTSLTEVLKEGRTSGVGHRRNRLRSYLVAGELALATVLVVTSGLMLRTLSHLRAADPGFNAHNLITLDIGLPETAYQTDSQQAAFVRQLLESVRSIPGTHGTSVVDRLPFSGNASISSFTIEGRPIPLASERPRAVYHVTSPDYFSTMQIGFLRGRAFTDSDAAGQTGVAIINDAAMRTYWPGEDPIGKRIKRGRPESKNPWLLIVGIVHSASQLSIREQLQPEIYVPFAQHPSRDFTLVARIGPNTDAFVGPIRNAVWANEKTLPTANMKLMDELMNDSITQTRFIGGLLSAFALVALTIAAIGVYGVVSYSVALRTQEFGIRMALGATPLDILKDVLRRGLRLALIGVLVGIGLSVAVTRMIGTLLYNVSATDPLTLILTSSVLIIFAAIASYIPARRATKVEPVSALRF